MKIGNSVKDEDKSKYQILQQNSTNNDFKRKENQNFVTEFVCVIMQISSLINQCICYLYYLYKFDY